MKNKPLFGTCLAAVLSASIATSAPLGTAFTYQGRLNSGATPASGIYDLRFTVFDAAAGGGAVGSPLTINAAGVTNGLFTVALDFGPSVFNGDARWLELAVRTNGGASFVMLAPRQPLTPTPYALYALTPAGPQGPQGPQGPSTTTANTLYIGSDQNATQPNSTLALGTDNQPRLTLLENGHVGIGTTAPATNLHVIGAVRATAFEGSGAGLTGMVPADNSITSAKIADGAVTLPKLANNAVTSSRIADNSVGAVDLASDAASLAKVTKGIMRITGDSAFIAGDAFLEDHDLYLRGDWNHGLGWYGAGKTFAGLSLDGPVLFGYAGGSLGTVNGGQKLALGWDSNGKVFTDPSSQNNGALQPGLIFGGSSSGEGIASKRTAGGNQFGLDFYTGFQPRLSIANNGHCTINGDLTVNTSGYDGPGSGSFVTVNGFLRVMAIRTGDYSIVRFNVATGEFFLDNSSRRYKENIRPLEADFAALLQAQPMTYTRPGRPDRSEVGFIAEDFHALGLTPLVEYDAAGQPAGVRYDKVSLYLLEIVKAQQSELRQQADRIAALEQQAARVGALEQTVAELQSLQQSVTELKAALAQRAQSGN